MRFIPKRKTNFTHSYSVYSYLQYNKATNITNVFDIHKNSFHDRQKYTNTHRTMAHGSWIMDLGAKQQILWHNWKCGKTIAIPNLFTRLINGMYLLMLSIYQKKKKTGNLWSHSHTQHSTLDTRQSFIQLLNIFQVYHSICVVEIR